MLMKKINLNFLFSKGRKGSGPTYKSLVINALVLYMELKAMGITWEIDDDMRRQEKLIPLKGKHNPRLDSSTPEILAHFHSQKCVCTVKLPKARVKI